MRWASPAPAPRNASTASPGSPSGCSACRSRRSPWSTGRPSGSSRRSASRTSTPRGPARSVGGDFVDWYRTDDGGFAVTLGDVMGKGMGAALLMATVRSVMRTAGRALEPADALAEAARALDDDLGRTATMVTLCHARVDPRTGTMLAVDAGHGLAMTV